MTLKTELLALKDREGILRIDAAHDWAAKNPKSALHQALEWDDTRAGREFRYQQIRQLIRLHVTIDGDGPQLVSLSIDRRKPGGGYRDIGDVLGDRKLSDILLQDAIAELERVQAKYATVEELTAVWRELERVKTRQVRRRPKPSGDVVITA